MKKITLILFALFLIISFQKHVFSQSGWFVQNPNPTGNLLTSTSFANSTIGYAVGQNGTLIKTVDGGVSWSLLNTGHNGIYDFFSSVHFTNPNTGYIAGGGGGLGSGLILKTTNAGLNWMQINPSPNYPINGIFFVNDLTGFAAGSYGKIFKTTNAGMEWSTQTVTTSHLGPVFFVNTNVGYVSGNDSCFFKTTNGGANWVRITNAGRSWNGDMYFINESTGFSCTWLDGLKKTTNGGSNWFVSENTRLWSAVYFINTNTGFICGDGCETKKTTNSGQNWFPVNGANLYQGLKDIVFVDTINGIAVGDEGIIRRSSNGGINWASFDNTSRDSLYSIVFAGNIGYTAGGNGTVMKSTNAGLSWVAQSKITAATITDLCLLNSNEVVGVGTGRKIIKTTNGGTNWISVTPGNYSNHLFSVDKAGSTTLVAVGSFGLIMKSTNSGANWSNITGPVTSTLKSVSFSDSLNGTAVGIGGTMLKTSNAGNTWTQIITGDFTTNDLNGICFLNSNTGIAVGASGTILKTTNGGINWVQKTSGSIDDIISVSISGSVCYAILYSSYVLKSTNLGENWTSHFTQTNSALLSVFFNDANTGWICGTGGAILKTTDGGGVFIQKIKSEVPSGFVLEQNYPNPFNPTTTIKFSIPSLSSPHALGGDLVLLKVFDVSGREVETLVNEQLQPGTYSVSFDAGHLPSGIYFYKLTAGDFSGTKKLILLK